VARRKSGNRILRRLCASHFFLISFKLAFFLFFIILISIATCQDLIGAMAQWPYGTEVLPQIGPTVIDRAS